MCYRPIHRGDMYSCWVLFPLVQPLFVTGQFPDEQTNAAVYVTPVYAGAVECLQPTKHRRERAVETVRL